jgi:hypothetical protein
MDSDYTLLFQPCDPVEQSFIYGGDTFCSHEQIIESFKGLGVRTCMQTKNIVEPAQTVESEMSNEIETKTSDSMMIHSFPFFSFYTCTMTVTGEEVCPFGRREGVRCRFTLHRGGGCRCGVVPGVTPFGNGASSH